MQNNADSNADHPLTSNDAVPGDALSTNATPDTASSSITAAREGNEEDAVTGLPKNDVDDSITSRSHNDSTRVERDYEDDNPTWSSSKQRRREHIQTPLVLPVSIPWGPASFLSFGGAASFGL